MVLIFLVEACSKMNRSSQSSDNVQELYRRELGEKTINVFFSSAWILVGKLPWSRVPQRLGVATIATQC